MLIDSEHSRAASLIACGIWSAGRSDYQDELAVRAALCRAAARRLATASGASDPMAAMTTVYPGSGCVRGFHETRLRSNR